MWKTVYIYNARKLIFLTPSVLYIHTRVASVRVQVADSVELQRVVYATTLSRRSGRRGRRRRRRWRVHGSGVESRLNSNERRNGFAIYIYPGRRTLSAVAVPLIRPKLINAPPPLWQTERESLLSMNLISIRGWRCCGKSP